MKITPELLKEMGFEQQKNRNDIFIDEWYIKMHGYLFTIKGGPDQWRYYGPGTYDPHYHCVTDVEEIFGFAYEDAYESGKECFKHELREFLGVDKKR